MPIHVNLKQSNCSQSDFIAGTAILSKFKPLAHKIGIPGWEESSGRETLLLTHNNPLLTRTTGYVELEFEDLFVVGTYVPNSGENFKVRRTYTV